MQKIWQGIFWKILSCGCFAGINILVRYLSGGSPLGLTKPLPIYSIMFFQNIIGMLALSIWIWRSNQHGMLFRTDKPWIHALRIITAAFGIGLWYISLRCIPVTQVVALSFVAPIITVIGAVFFLKENFNLQRKLAVILSLLGSFLIARPDQILNNTETFSWYLLLPLLAAFVFTFEKLLTRRLLSRQESPTALAWYLLTFIAPLCLLPIFYYGWVAPDAQHVPWLLLLGVTSALANYSFNKAYSMAEITYLLPFGAAKIILCSGMSYLAFYEIPKTFDMWLGVLIITASTIILGANPKFFAKHKTIGSFA